MLRRLIEALFGRGSSNQKKVRVTAIDTWDVDGFLEEDFPNPQEFDFDAESEESKQPITLGDYPRLAEKKEFKKGAPEVKPLDRRLASAEETRRMFGL